MRRAVQITGCLLTLLVTSCGEKKTVESREPAPAIAPDPAQQQPVAQNRASNASPQAKVAQAPTANTDAPAPPRDAQFTIVCKIISGPGHVQTAVNLKNDLIKSTPMKTWYVSHDEAKSTLFYGYYKKVDDPQLKSDRQKIVMMQNNLGNRPFTEALPVAINSPDPTAPPEMNLLNANGFWSLQIAAYQGQGRKEAAVEAVEEARKMGVEAYYHHGPNVSEVCIGAWPESAVRKQEMDGGGGVDVLDRERPILVLGPGAEVPRSVKEEYSKNLVEKESGKKVQVLEQKVDVVDPTMRAAMEKYPNHVLNGLEEATQVHDPVTGQMRNVPKHSMIVQIPHNSSILQNDMAAPAPAMIAPAAPSPQIGGKLRSVGP